MDQWFSSLFEHPLIPLFLKTKCCTESQYMYRIQIKVELTWLKEGLVSLNQRLFSHSGFQ